MTEPAFDVEGMFDEEYLYFYAGPLDARGDAEAELIWRLLEVEPGMEVLDLAYGHGRIANALAARGCRVTGLDATPLFPERARHDATARGSRLPTLKVTCGSAVDRTVRSGDQLVLFLRLFRRCGQPPSATRRSPVCSSLAAGSRWK